MAAGTLIRHFSAHGQELACLVPVTVKAFLASQQEQVPGRGWGLGWAGLGVVLLA